MTDDTAIVREALERIAGFVRGAPWEHQSAQVQRKLWDAAKIDLQSAFDAMSHLTARLDAERGKRWRHLKRGTVYTEVGRGTMQTEEWGWDEHEVVVYRGDDGRLWVRPVPEFEDGRFEPLPTPPGADHG